MSKNLFIGNLSYDTTEDTLREKIAVYGEIVSLRIATDKMTGTSKGFAFVDMATDEQGQAAIDALNGMELDGKNIAVRVKEDRSENAPVSAKKLFVGNLSYNTTEETIREKLGEFGEVTSLRLVMDQNTGTSKGFGFAEMATEEQGKAAIEGLNGQDFDGRSIVVREDRPQPKRERSFGGGDRRPSYNRDSGRSSYGNNDRSGGFNRRERNYSDQY